MATVERIEKVVDLSQRDSQRVRLGVGQNRRALRDKIRVGDEDDGLSWKIEVIYKLIRCCSGIRLYHRFLADLYVDVKSRLQSRRIERIRCDSNPIGLFVVRSG